MLHPVEMMNKQRRDSVLKITNIVFQLDYRSLPFLGAKNTTHLIYLLLRPPNSKNIKLDLSDVIDPLIEKKRLQSEVSQKNTRKET